MKKLNLSKALTKRMADVPLGWPSPNLTAQKGTFARKLVTDLHGPIADFLTPVCKLAKGVLPGCDPKPSDTKYYQSAYDAAFGISPKDWGRIFETFARLGKGGYGDLPIRKGVIEQYKAIRDAGIPIEVWTWVPGAAEHTFDTKKPYGTGIAQSATYEMLSKLGFLDNVEKQVRFISPSAKAPTMAEEHLPLIIEDNPATAVQVGANYGSCCILTPESYTTHIVSPGVLRIDDMSDLAPAVIDFFQKLDEAGALESVGKSKR